MHLVVLRLTGRELVARRTQLEPRAIREPRLAVREAVVRPVDVEARTARAARFTLSKESIGAGFSALNNTTLLARSLCVVPAPFFSVGFCLFCVPGPFSFLTCVPVVTPATELLKRGITCSASDFVFAEFTPSIFS